MALAHGVAPEDTPPDQFLLYNVKMANVEDILLNVRLSELQKGQKSNMPPRRVRLSDSAVGLVIAMGVTTKNRGEWWPADFDQNGQTRAGRGHIGETFLLIEDGAIKVAECMFPNRACILTGSLRL